MKSTTAILTVKLLGDNQTGKAFKEAQSSAQKFEQGMDKAAGVATVALGGLAAAGTGAALAAEAVASANAVVGNVLGNMGMDKATDRVLDYADALEKSLGIDEKVIKNTQGKLATFSELASSADEAGGAFDRATMAALDMAAAGFGSAEQNAVQLGKALQDPVKGITALQRSGVTFTESQKEMIEAMVEAGDMAGAQNLILAELEKQVGGTAEATADSSAKTKLAFGEVAEQVGVALLPVMDMLAEKALAFSEWASNNTGTITTLAGVIGGLAAAVVGVNTAMKVWNTVAAITDGIQKLMETSVGKAVIAWIKQGIAVAKSTAKLILHNAAELAGAAIRGVVTAAQALLNLVMAANPITLVILAVVALVGVFILLWNKCDGFREAVKKLWDILKNAFLTVLDAVKTAFSKVWEWVKKVGDFIGNVFTGAWNGLKGAIDWVRDAVKGVIDWFKRLWDRIKEVAGALGDFIGKLNPFKGLFGGRSRMDIRYAGGFAAAPRSTQTTINVRATGYNPQREARELARLLTGAQVRTGFRGVRAA